MDSMEGSSSTHEKASLSGLPMELKQLIIRFCYDIDEADVNGDDEESVIVKNEDGPPPLIDPSMRDQPSTSAQINAKAKEVGKGGDEDEWEDASDSEDGLYETDSEGDDYLPGGRGNGRNGTRRSSTQGRSARSSLPTVGVGSPNAKGKGKGRESIAEGSTAEGVGVGDGDESMQNLEEVEEESVDIEGTLERSALQSLSEVNHEFRELSLPLLWKDLNLQGISNPKLQLLVDRTAPKYGHFVRDIWFRISFRENLEYEDVIPLEEYDGWDAHERLLIFKKLLPLLPNIEFWDSDWVTDAPGGNTDFHEILQWICLRGPKITQLSLISAPPGEEWEDEVMNMTEDHGILIAQNLRNLKKLSLTGIGPDPDEQLLVPEVTDETETSRLFVALALLHKLESLEIADTGLVDDTWGTGKHPVVKLSDRLSAIAFEECPFLTSKGWEGFVERNGKNLKAIRIYNVMAEDQILPGQDPEDWEDGRLPERLLPSQSPRPSRNATRQRPAYRHEPYPLPKLNELYISNTEFSLFTLSHFTRSPIKKLQLGYLPRMGHRDHQAIVEHRGLLFPSLEKLHITRETDLSESTLEALDVMCFNKLEFRVVDAEWTDDEDDSDDDEYEEDDDFDIEQDDFEEGDEEDEDFEDEEDEEGGGGGGGGGGHGHGGSLFNFVVVGENTAAEEDENEEANRTWMTEVD